MELVELCAPCFNPHRSAYADASRVPRSSTVTPLPLTALRDGAALFDRGAWWEAHEVWEHAWRHLHGLPRHYLKGMIQLAAVNWHLARGNRRAARRLLDTAVPHLCGSVPLAWPIDTGHLLTVCSALAARIDRGLPVKPVHLHLVNMIAHHTQPKPT